MNETEIQNLYINPAFIGSFGGLKRFYQEVKKIHPKIKYKSIKKALKSERSYSLHKTINKPKYYRKVYTKAINYLWQADLLDLQKYSCKNRGFRYCCFVIDTLSKKLWVFPIKRKTALQLTKAISMLLTSERPQKLQVCAYLFHN